MSKLQEKPSALNREHPALQNMTFLNFLLFLWVIFALLDSDSDPNHWVRIYNFWIYDGKKEIPELVFPFNWHTIRSKYPQIQVRTTKGAEHKIFFFVFLYVNLYKK
jgi:hypothetical protein